MYLHYFFLILTVVFTFLKKKIFKNLLEHIQEVSLALLALILIEHNATSGKNKNLEKEYFRNPNL